MQCKSCQTALAADAKFCHECGEKVSVDRTCKECETVNALSAKFCKNCGAALAANVKAKTASKKSGQTLAAGASLNKSQTLFLGGITFIALIIALVYYYVGFEQTVEGKTEWQHAQEAVQADDHDHNNDGEPDHQAPSQAAIDAAIEHVKHAPEDSEANANLANLYFDSGKFEEAIPYYQKSLQISPDNPDVIVDLGVCFFNLKDYAKAKSQFELALNKAPDHVNALYNSGVVAVQLGEVQQLIQFWTKLREVAPDSPQAQRARQILEQIHDQVSNQPDGES